MKPRFGEYIVKHKEVESLKALNTFLIQEGIDAECIISTNTIYQTDMIEIFYWGT